MAEATIDELQIEIEADGADAAQSLEKLQQTLERLLSPVQALTTGNGLNKLTKHKQAFAGFRSSPGDSGISGRICAAFFTHECVEQSAKYSGYTAYAAHQQPVTASGGGSGYKFNARDRHIAH